MFYEKSIRTPNILNLYSQKFDHFNSHLYSTKLSTKRTSFNQLLFITILMNWGPIDKYQNSCLTSPIQLIYIMVIIYKKWHSNGTSPCFRHVWSLWLLSIPIEVEPIVLLKPWLLQSWITGIKHEPRFIMALQISHGVQYLFNLPCSRQVNVLVHEIKF